MRPVWLSTEADFAGKQRRSLLFSFLLCPFSLFCFPQKTFAVLTPRRYSTISVVTLTNAENMIINYNDGSAPDYIKASEADIKEMIRLIKTRSPKDIQVVVESA